MKLPSVSLTALLLTAGVPIDAEGKTNMVRSLNVKGAGGSKEVKGSSKGKGESTSSKGKSKSTPTPKPTPPKPTVCNKRMNSAFSAIVASNFTKEFNVTQPTDVMKLCKFEPPPVPGPNFGCSFVYDPTFGFIKDFTGLINPEELADAFTQINLYCECYQGYELGCASTVPHGPPTTIIDGTETSSYSEFIPFSTPAKRAEYCKFAGVWNGDFDVQDVHVPEEVMKCGCFWVGTAQEMVGECPGVELGAFFPPPPPPPTPTPPSGSQMFASPPTPSGPPPLHIGIITRNP